MRETECVCQCVREECGRGSIPAQTHGREKVETLATFADANVTGNAPPFLEGCHKPKAIHQKKNKTPYTINPASQPLNPKP